MLHHYRQPGLALVVGELVSAFAQRPRRSWYGDHDRGGVPGEGASEIIGPELAAAWELLGQEPPDPDPEVSRSHNGYANGCGHGFNSSSAALG
jgi:hypothetical protein